MANNEKIRNRLKSLEMTMREEDGICIIEKDGKAFLNGREITRERCQDLMSSSRPIITIIDNIPEEG